MHYYIVFLINLTLLIMTGCGFHVQMLNQIPKKTINLSINDPYGPLGLAIKKELYLNNIEYINKNSKNIITLKIISISENTQTISIYQNGQNAEKKLNFLISAEIILQNGFVHPIHINVEHIFFDIPLDILSADAKNKMIKEELYARIASQLIHKLLIIQNDMHNNIKNNTNKKEY
ncbi:LPS assembly lipoprotein LptE [Arsenophonus symbiont of Ornithomya chloropus]|uniref:LPS assembly lipoprotein LptE n=1 Tax=Arsenophonus symbiont of Ornithomya chloropus TaxID=634121 RepID=UPI0032B2F48A